MTVTINALTIAYGVLAIIVVLIITSFVSYVRKAKEDDSNAGVELLFASFYTGLTIPAVACICLLT